MPINRSLPPGPVIPELPYEDVTGAARWLCNAFGFTERLRIGSDRIQLRVGTGAIVVVEAGAGVAAGARVMVLVADSDPARWAESWSTRSGHLPDVGGWPIG